MLIVKTFVDSSPVHGRGLFADEDILPGTVIWREGFELLFSSEHFERLSDYEKEFISIWGWKDKHDGFHHLSLDYDRFINHSNDANTFVGKNGLTIAKRFIHRGEEIFCNYAEFEAEFRFNEYLCSTA